MLSELISPLEDSDCFHRKDVPGLLAQEAGKAEDAAAVGAAAIVAVLDAHQWCDLCLLDLDVTGFTDRFDLLQYESVIWVVNKAR